MEQSGDIEREDRMIAAAAGHSVHIAVDVLALNPNVALTGEVILHIHGG